MAHILVIDDEPNYIKAIGRILRLIGHTSQGAHNGQEALELLKHKQFDLIISDTNMGTMDGPAFVRAFRLTDQVTPIVMNSGGGLQSEVQELLKARALQYYVNKGILNEEWKEILLQFLPPATP